VRDEFGDALTVLDGGPCGVGIESTIIDCTRAEPVLLRPGILTRAQIEAVAGMPLKDRDAAAPRASGTLEAHYAPRAKVRLMDSAMLQQALGMLPADPGEMGLAVYSRSARPPAWPSAVLHRRMPDDAAAAAQELFSVLRDLDADGARLVWVEQPPATPEWEGVRDRLQRAAAAA
jgi:L-threonylcarbamoyladenylate synthase